jgi:hypothetical protein
VRGHICGVRVVCVLSRMSCVRVCGGWVTGEVAGSVQLVKASVTSHGNQFSDPGFLPILLSFACCALSEVHFMNMAVRAVVCGPRKNGSKQPGVPCSNTRAGNWCC